MSRLIPHMKYIFIVYLFVGVGYVLAYTMPVGIPSVIDETQINFTQVKPERPNDWSKEVPGYYYVDMQNGSSKATYGSETTPRKYLPTNPIPAGSYIEISGNYQINSGYYRITANGTNTNWVANASGPVWITQKENSSAAFTKGRLILTGKNIFISDLSFINGGRPQIGSSSTGYDIKNVVVRNNDISGDNVAGIGISTGHAENAIIYNNKIHGMGDIDTTYDQDSHLITIGGESSNIWILDNEGYNASGSGLQVNGSSTSTHNIYVGNNEIYNVRQSGLWVKLGKDIIFSSNYVHDIISTSWSVSKGMGAQYEPNGFWMVNNHIKGAEYGIRIASTNSTDYHQKVYIIGNIIHDIEPVQSPNSIGGSNTWQSAAIHLVGAHEVYIYNNLIFDAPNGIDSSSGGALTKIKNNIIFDLTRGQKDGAFGRSIWAEFINTQDDGFEVSNNYFDSNMFIQQAGNKYYTLSDLKSFGGIDNIIGAQLFSEMEIEEIIKQKSINGFDLSNVIDKGANIDSTLTNDFNNMFTNLASISQDILGALRKQGTSIDIGPFETGGNNSESTTKTTVPEKPGNISVITP